MEGRAGVGELKRGRSKVSVARRLELAVGTTEPAKVGCPVELVVREVRLTGGAGEGGFGGGKAAEAGGLIDGILCGDVGGEAVANA
jgi:hypothetical protein